jgi:hypothetical protein
VSPTLPSKRLVAREVLSGFEGGGFPIAYVTTATAHTVQRTPHSHSLLTVLMALHCVCCRYVARRLGLDSVQTVHLPSHTNEIVATNAASLYDEGTNEPSSAHRDPDAPDAPLAAPGGTEQRVHISPPRKRAPHSENACGEAELRTGPSADAQCECERRSVVINCAQVVWSHTNGNGVGRS